MQGAGKPTRRQATPSRGCARRIPTCERAGFGRLGRILKLTGNRPPWLAEVRFAGPVWNSAISSCSLAVWIFRWPQPSVTVGMPWAVSQLASRPPLVTANSAVRSSASIAAAAAATHGSSRLKRNDS